LIGTDITCSGVAVVAEVLLSQAVGVGVPVVAAQAENLLLWPIYILSRPLSAYRRLGRRVVWK
jgi:hypothetical protein